MDATINHESTTVQNHRLRMLSRRHWGLSLLYCQIFVLDSAVAKQKEKDVKLAWRLPYLSNISPWENNQIYNTLPGNKENGSQLTDTQELKKNLNWATAGPAKDTEHQALTHRWKWYAIVVIESVVLTHRELHAFLIQYDFFFVLFSISNGIKTTSLKHRLELKFHFCDFRFRPFQIK